MVGAIGNAAVTSTTPLSVRASAAESILSSDSSQPAAQPSTQVSDIISSSADSKLPLYNSIEFIYKQDYGKVVLLEQQPDTGQEITQVPSQYRLQQYAANLRAQRRVQLEKLQGGGEEGEPQKKSSAGQPAVSAATGSTSGLKPTGTAAPSPAPQSAPAPQAAPQVAASGAAGVASVAAHVDIRV